MDIIVVCWLLVPPALYTFDTRYTEMYGAGLLPDHKQVALIFYSTPLTLWRA